MVTKRERDGDTVSELRHDVLRDLEEQIQPLCREIDFRLGGGLRAKDVGVGFAILLFRFDGPETTYGSNSRREDMIKALRECADRLEARSDSPPGTGGMAKGGG